MTQSARAVIVGAGIAGAAAAYFLTVRHGLTDVAVVEQGDPLSLTSDKSSECYRNWWPGPGSAMVDLTNRSIDLLEELSEGSGERFRMNRRGYAFATAAPGIAESLRQEAEDGEIRGSGPLRVHDGRGGATAYQPRSVSGWREQPIGTDLLLDPDLIQRSFPGISPRTLAVLHVRRCGWLSAQQLGAYYLEAARAAGARLVRGRVSGIDQRNGAVTGVRIDGGTPSYLATDRLVLSPGPHLNDLLDLLDVSLPVSCECHVKVALRDSRRVMTGKEPLMVWSDPVSLPWTDEERTILAESPETQYLLQPFAAGVHGRPEGQPGQHHLLALWTYDVHTAEPTFPIDWDPHMPEIIVRGMSAMYPGMSTYFDPLPPLPVDGGYYTKLPDNRPVIGPLPIDGAFLNAGYSGFGIMASAAGAELLAAHLTGGELPDYAGALAPGRFDDPSYLASFADNTAGQL